MDENTRVAPPKQAFDPEYMTEWGREKRYLESKGIKPNFVRVTKDYGIRQYKYKKTAQLFATLTEFYAQVAYEKAYESLDKIASTGIPVKLDKKDDTE